MNKNIWHTTFLTGIVVWVLTACNAATPLVTPTLSATPTVAPAPAPVGFYKCTGNEGGLLAAAGDLTLSADNTFQFNDEESGTWEVEASQGSTRFNGSSYLDNGHYDPVAKTLTVILKPGAVLPHAETGTLTCYLR